MMGVWIVYLIGVVVVMVYGCWSIHKATKERPNTIKELLDIAQCLPPGYEISIKFVRGGVCLLCEWPDHVVGGELIGLIELPGKLASAGNIRFSFCDFTHRAQGHHAKDDNRVKEDKL